jgi:hypothetical protein
MEARGEGGDATTTTESERHLAAEARGEERLVPALQYRQCMHPSPNYVVYFAPFPAFFVSTAASPVDSSLTVSKYRALRAWLERHTPAAHFVGIDIKEFEFYRGIGATQNIEQGTTIMSVPRELCITTSDTQETEVAKKLMQGGATFSEDQPWFALFWLLQTTDPNSKWKHYLDVLPSSYDFMPVMWAQEEIEFLNGQEEKAETG